MFVGRIGGLGLLWEAKGGVLSECSWDFSDGDCGCKVPSASIAVWNSGASGLSGVPLDRPGTSVIVVTVCMAVEPNRFSLALSMFQSGSQHVQLCSHLLLF